MKITLLGFFFALIAVFANAQNNVYGGIEIGGKGIKVAVIKITDLNVGKFEIVKYWTRNTAVTKNISQNGNLADSDISETAGAVKELIDQLKADYSLPDERIYVIGSSGVAMAKNRDALAKKLKDVAQRDLDFISSEQEGKLVTKGAVPASKYKDALILDIGGGNTKGGYVDEDDGGHRVFYGLAIEYGSVTLSEKLAKLAQTGEFSDYIGALTAFKDSTLKREIKSMYNNKPESRRKKTMYMIGGAVWAFAVLSKPANNDNYMSFNYQDVKNYYDALINDYDKLTAPDLSRLPEADRARAEKNLEAVRKTYSREALIAGALIMRESIADTDNPDKKELFFVRQGHVAWIIAYIVDYTRKMGK